MKARQKNMKKVYPERSRRVFVAMSGGVDSSVAAALLQREGYDVTGVFMKGWSDTSFFKDKTMCPWVADQEAARKAAAVLDIPFYTWDVEEEYKKKVVDYMVSSYRKGITPNPDVMCNKEIKFGVFLERASKLGADYIATGHYARIYAPRNSVFARPDPQRGSQQKQNSASAYQLLDATDKNKDQSYFLWTLTQLQLQRILFPVGAYTKPQVREMAREYELPNAERKDSQGVCFVGELEVFDFLQSVIPAKRGPVLTSAGKKVGEHEGTMYYTIGQRHGIGSVGGGTAYYVAEKDAERNVLVVAEGESDPKLYRNELTVYDVNWISGEVPSFPMKCKVRIRYRQPLQKATVNMKHSTVDRKENHTGQLSLRFEEPQRAVTPGQSAVFYNDEIMLGGGVIR